MVRVSRDEITVYLDLRRRWDQVGGCLMDVLYLSCLVIASHRQRGALESLAINTIGQARQESCPTRHSANTSAAGHLIYISVAELGPPTRV